MPDGNDTPLQQGAGYYSQDDRSSHHWKAGTRFVIEEVQGGVLLKPISSFPETDLQSGLGCTGYKGPAKSPEEMAADVEAVQRHKQADIINLFHKVEYDSAYDYKDQRKKR